jgi:SpoIIAA-like
MPYEIVSRADELLWIRVSGRLAKADYDAACELLLDTLLRQGKAPRLLVSLDGFLGWEGSQEWSDLAFLSRHGDEIAKIAVVGDRRWEDEVMMFSGAPMRKTPVRFFDAPDLELAKAWLAQ